MQGFQFELHATELGCYQNESVQVKEDVNSLFNVVQCVLKHAISVAEKCLLGRNETINIENTPVSSINCSVNVLKRIYFTVACEADDKRDISNSIVGILSTYSGAERAVLTLAAFALSYGELLYYIDRQQLNPFALLISYLRGVDELIRVQQEHQFKAAIRDLNGLTKLTLQLVGLVLELDNLSKKDYIDDLSVVTEITGYVEHYSFLAVQVVVACMTQVNYLTYDRVATWKGLSSLASVLNESLITIKETVEEYKLIVAEWQAYWELHTCFSKRAGIIEVFTRLMYPLEPYLDCGIVKPVRVDELLKGKNVLLFISEPDISDADFEILKTIHEGLEKEHRDYNYKIVWIPVVEQWTPKSLMDFNKWKKKLQWYVVCYEAGTPIVGIKYIKKRWHFSHKPMVVALNSQGAIECLHAMQLIRAWGTLAFPFFTTRPTKPDPGMRPIIVSIINQQIENEKYILLYGGKEKWINDFRENLAELENDSYVSSKVSLTSFAVEVKNSNIVSGQFWTRMESLLYVRMQWNRVDDTAIQIQKLLSFQKEDGWALLCKGSTILACASGTVILNAVANHRDWTMYLETKKFEICLREYLAIDDVGKCYHVPIQSVGGWLPVDVKCPQCGERMDRLVTYKCCHEKNKENGAL